MGFDYEARLTWIEDLHTDPSRDRYTLCGLHAEKFRSPVGWKLEDRRGVDSVLHPPARIPPPVKVKVEVGRELASETVENGHIRPLFND